MRGVEPAHVFAEWLTDSAAFNEWCEEEDYLWEDPAAAATRAAREATRAREAEALRAASFGTLPGVGLVEDQADQADDDDAYPKPKKVRREKTAGSGGEVLAPSRFAERVAPDVTRRMVVTPHRVVFAACAGDFGDGPAAVLAAAGDAGDGIPGIPALPGAPAARGVPVIENISRGQRTAARAPPPRRWRRRWTTRRRRRARTPRTPNAGPRATTPRASPPGPTRARTLCRGTPRGSGETPCTRSSGVACLSFSPRAPATTPSLATARFRDATMARFVEKGSFLRFDAATRRAMAAAAPGANADADTYATQQRVYDFCHRWGLINWTAVDQTGGPRLIDPGARRDEIKSEKPAGTNAAAADALFRFDPAPADGAAAVAAAPSRRRASWRRARRASGK